MSPKGDLRIQSGDYAPVAERISLFYPGFPAGRIVTELVSRTAEDVVFRAVVYRSPDEREPAATGWAAEREGDGEINTVACLENTETSAIGQALANLGFLASSNRPSREEMAKADRVRVRQGRQHSLRTSAGGAAVVSERDHPGYAALQERADRITDALQLIQAAESLGLRPARSRRMKSMLFGPAPDARGLSRIAIVLRRWIAKQSGRTAAP